MSTFKVGDRVKLINDIVTIPSTDRESKVGDIWLPDSQLTKVEPVERESEFKPGDLVEVSDSGKAWVERFYVGIKRCKMYVTEHPNDGTLNFWIYCRKPIPKKVKWNVWSDNKDSEFTLYTRKDGYKMPDCTIVHSFELDEK